MTRANDPAPAVEELRRLARVGFHMEQVLNPDDQLALVCYVRYHGSGLRDVVIVYNDREAFAYRTPTGADHLNPLEVAREAVQWCLHGEVVTVVHGILSLGHGLQPRTTGGPVDVVGGRVEFSDARLSPDETDAFATKLHCAAAQARQQQVDQP